MMSTSTHKKSHVEPRFDVESVTRMPRQGRSRASFERMLVAARELMLERGNEDFTLQDVSQRGSVSIGSIYLRFESKDNLVRAVIANALEDIAKDEDEMLAKLDAECSTLEELVPSYVNSYAEVLRRNASLLRLAMARAAIDPLVSEPGKARAFAAARAGADAMLRFRDQFGGEDNEVKASAAFNIIFATIARELSLGATGESATNYDWQLLKNELGRMCLSYLKGD